MEEQRRGKTSSASEPEDFPSAKLMVQRIVKEINSRCKDLDNYGYHEFLFIAIHKSQKDNIEIGTDLALGVANGKRLLYSLLCAASKADETPEDASDAKSHDGSHDHTTYAVTMEIKTENDDVDGRKEHTSSCRITNQPSVKLESPDMSHDQPTDWTAIEIKTEKEDGTYEEGTSGSLIVFQPGLESPDLSHDQVTEGITREIKTEKVDEKFEGIMCGYLEGSEESDHMPNSAISRGDGAQYPAGNRLGPSFSGGTKEPGMNFRSLEEGEKSNNIPDSTILRRDDAHYPPAKTVGPSCSSVIEDPGMICGSSDEGRSSDEGGSSEESRFSEEGSSSEEDEESNNILNSAFPRKDGAQYPAANRIGPSCSGVTEDPGMICGSSEEGWESDNIPNFSIPRRDGAQYAAAKSKGLSCSSNPISEDPGTGREESDRGHKSVLRNVNESSPGLAVEGNTDESQSSVGFGKSDITKGPHECDVCSEVFTCERTLQIHATSHARQRPCERTLQIHGTSHCTRQRPYKCHVCSKTFSQMIILHAHIKTVHVGQTIYRCNECSKTFTTSGNLQKHIRFIHAAERPYECSVCSKAFARELVLRGHMRSHTGEKPYKCSMCPKAFGWKSTLNRHIRTHTGPGGQLPLKG